MRRLLIAAACLIAAHAIGSAQAAPPRRLVMISIDGLSAADVRTTTAKIPALRALAARGASASGVRGVVPTVTYPSHTTLITGVLPAVHGIVDNRILDPEGRSDEAWYWYAEAIRVPTLLDAVKASGGATAAVSWPVTVGMELDYNVPEFWRSQHPETLSLIKALSRPRGVIDMAQAGRGTPFSWPQTDRDRTDIAKYLVRSVTRGAVLVHLIEYDNRQHNAGPGSRAAIEALERADGYVGELVAEASAAGTASDTVIAVVSDHGFRTYTTTVYPNALFRREGLLTVSGSGTVTDWQAYYHPSGGGGFVFLKRPEDEGLRARVGLLLAQLKADEENGIEVLRTRAELDRLGADPRAAFWIGMRSGYYTGDDTRELRRTGSPRGGHGYDPASPDMLAAFIVSGDAVPRRGDLGVVRMTQIAPTLARLLGLTLAAPADAPLW